MEGPSVPSVPPHPSREHTLGRAQQVDRLRSGRRVRPPQPPSLSPRSDSSSFTVSECPPHTPAPHAAHVTSRSLLGSSCCEPLVTENQIFPCPDLRGAGWRASCGGPGCVEEVWPLEGRTFPVRSPAPASSLDTWNPSTAFA